jgi:phytoene synthase
VSETFQAKADSGATPLSASAQNEQQQHGHDRFDPAELEKAYELSRRITRKGSKTFYFSTVFLPKEKRRAMWAIYCFCRFTDDMVDTADTADMEELISKLDLWEHELKTSFQQSQPPSQPHMLAWLHTTNFYKIPLHPPLDMIKGVRMDLSQNRYNNFEELRLYCYRVASTVGLMTSQVIGYSEPIALDYAVELGIAMQLTNILRDIGEDTKRGRIYLPLDEMAQFGYTEEELLRGEINERFINLMKFQIERARKFYATAELGIDYLNKDSRLAVATAAHLYSRILDVIERNSYDVFNRRAFVPLDEKIGGLIRVWRKRRKASRS